MEHAQISLHAVHYCCCFISMIIIIIIRQLAFVLIINTE